MKLNTGPELIEVDGMIVEKDLYNVAQQIKKYDENLELLYLDPDRDQDGNISAEPWILAERCTDGQLRKIKGYWQLDERVMADIEAADTQRHNLEAVIAGKRIAIQQETERRYKELKEHRMDIVAHIAGMKSSTVVPDPVTGEPIKFYDDRPAVRGADAIKGKKQF